MKIGCPKEIKNNEFRVGLTPAAASAYVAAGHNVFIEKDAGKEAGFSDESYKAAGAEILPGASELWSSCDMIVKVKEPMPPEYHMMRKGQIIFTYFHLAADKELTEACVKSGASCVAYELVREPWGLPLLQPMSEVAGRMAVLMGAFYSAKKNGGSGILPTGVPGVAPARVFVIGGGNVGMNAAKVASGLGASVTITDINHKRLAYLSEIMPANCVTVYNDPITLEENVKNADIVIGAILLPGGAQAPKVLKRKHIAMMKPGSVFVDVAIDQGGISETSHATTHDDPVFEVDGVIHYCVANMPGAYPKTSTTALSNATLNYGLLLAKDGAEAAARENAAIKEGLTVYKGKILTKAVADVFGMANDYMKADDALKL